MLHTSGYCGRNEKCRDQTTKEDQQRAPGSKGKLLISAKTKRQIFNKFTKLKSYEKFLEKIRKSMEENANASRTERPTQKKTCEMFHKILLANNFP